MQSYSSLYQDYSADNQIDYGRRPSEGGQARSRRTSIRRSNKVSTSVGGIHRRRNKRWSW
ncbi:MAG TPA: hypothetical protein VGJ26_20670 [Pirellulales bacterium]|jgi:hypothetical protein